jgi:ABC-type uncharacterized transport system YnjBCD ATPase subunit
MDCAAWHQPPVALRASMRESVWNELRRQQVCAVLVTHDEKDLPAGAQLIRLPVQQPTP